MKSLLITFGCSWTYGVGVCYTQDMSREEYMLHAWDSDICDQLSFRGLLASKYNLINENFSLGGSSNQTQFRRAKQFFCSTKFKQLQEQFSNIIVLWGITSTARNEMYMSSCKKRSSLKYADDLPEAKIMLKYFYDHDDEITQLTTEMAFWTDYFKSKGIQNYWFDTFNHHYYPATTTFIDNSEFLDALIFNSDNPRDLMSKLSLTNGLQSLDKNYHYSLWEKDSNRVEYLVDCGILNPISFHPTQLGHAQMADMLSPYIEKLL